MAEREYKMARGGAVVERLQGVMVETLAAAAEALTSPSVACMRVLKRNRLTTNLETTSRVLNIVNRYEGISVAAGTYVRAEYLDGEWSLYGADCVNTSISASSEGC